MISNAKIKIGVFSYNFEHYKSTMGLLNMLIYGIKPDVIYAANKENLNIKQSAFRSYTRGLYALNPRDLANLHKINYLVGRHNSVETIEDIKYRKPDLGIILGARILSKKVIDSFNIGIINIHAGILPNNRGLDNVQWAIRDDLPQAVTLHFINEEIDRGRKVLEERLSIQEDDTLLDIQMKLREKEQRLLIKFISKIKNVSNNWKESLPIIGEGKYHSVLERSDDFDFENSFIEYIKKWSSKNEY